MFSLRERLIASDIWTRVWGLGSLALAFWILFATVDFSLSALRSPLFVVMLVFAIPATALLSLIAAPIAGFLFFSDITDWQANRNGGPFTVGDRVVVIPGRNTGHLATVTSFGQCQSLRITLDGDDTETGAYAHHQLKRIE